MKSKENKVDFSDVTPKVNLKTKGLKELYEKAFFKPRQKPENDFCRNTTTWD